jgi:hypothetical protein
MNNRAITKKNKNNEKMFKKTKQNKKKKIINNKFLMKIFRISGILVY